MIFFANVVTLLLRLVVPSLTVPFTFGESNILIAQLLLFNWLLMINLYVLQISIAMSTQFGQATTSQLWLALASYFTYSQLFIVVSVHVGHLGNSRCDPAPQRQRLGKDQAL